MFVPLSPCQTCSPAQIKKSFWLHKYSSGHQKVRVYICCCSTHQVIRPAKKLKMSKRPSSVSAPTYADGSKFVGKWGNSRYRTDYLTHPARKNLSKMYEDQSPTPVPAPAPAPASVPAQVSRQSSLMYMDDADDAVILMADQLERTQPLKMYDYQSTPRTKHPYPTSSSWPPSSYKYLTETPDAMILMPKLVMDDDDTRMLMDENEHRRLQQQRQQNLMNMSVDLTKPPPKILKPGHPDNIASDGTPIGSAAVPERKRKIFPPCNNDRMLPLEDQGNRFMSTGTYNNRVHVSIREYNFHEDVQQWFPSGKGINLTKPQWEMLKSHAGRIDKMLEDEAPIIMHV
jgi:hypothetical protein